ncbi:MAG: helix-turn-helix domain-containing protein [Bacilli bacterium]|nr:helix-turn-helix domain-containing protein [Bacilli bacterium]
MKELGNYLKTARIKNGVSLTEVSEDLELSTTLLENIESGNVRAFKDVYELKEYIKRYAKYLGADLEKVNDQFNDFLFEKTSKISVEDIKQAQIEKDNTDNKKIISPYTLMKKPKINFMPVIIFICIVLALFLIIYIIFTSVKKVPNITKELRGEWSVDEYTY